MIRLLRDTSTGEWYEEAVWWQELAGGKCNEKAKRARGLVPDMVPMSVYPEWKVLASPLHDGENVPASSHCIEKRVSVLGVGSTCGGSVLCKLFVKIGRAHV